MRQIRNSIIVLVSILLMTIATPAFAAKPGLSDFPEPLDPQSWVLPEDMTWDDYKPVPGYDWQNTDIEPTRVLRGALVVVDFNDREFIVSQEVGSELAGNPINGNIPREDIPQFWENFLTMPQELNNYTTIDQFWRENSFGNWAVELKAFGPYRMPHNEFDYGMNEWNQEENKPPISEGRFDLRRDASEIADADIEAYEDEVGAEFDFIFVLHAGYDESGVWQEFGEMMFLTPEDVPDEFGPPLAYDPYNLMPNWANTRYVPWTSWIAASSLWSRAGGGISIQGENDGMGTFAHEFGHIMGLADNYNNPYGIPVSRSYSGPWELMSRGSFNGPGGPHTRWMVMPTLGASAPSHHMLRNKIKQGFLSEDQYINIDRADLAEQELLFADILAREIPSGEEFGRPELYTGINITMDVDHTPVNSLEDDWRADMQRGADWYDNYTIEVVDRVGFDSFQTDSGVLLAKTKDRETGVNIWVIDSHPEDINQVDFIRPDGTKAMYSKGDYRQLSDALFKAGTGDGVVNEYIDEYNNFHFYVLEKQYDEVGALSYRVGVRHMNPTVQFDRGVAVENSSSEFATPGKVAVYNFSVTNTGEATDIFRLHAETQAGWEVQLQNNFIEVAAGETVEVPVYVKVPKGKSTPNNLIFTSSSETESEKSASVTRRIGPGKGNK